MKRTLQLLLAGALPLSLACTQSPEPPIRIGINPWVGYEIFHLARETGILERCGANVDLVEYSSLGDVRRGFERGDVDGMATTIIEFLQVAEDPDVNPSVVMVADFSNGADVIVARGSIRSVAELRGRTVGAEPASLGMFVLTRALERSGLHLSDVTVVPLDQLEIVESYANGTVDAAVTYSPYSAGILQLVDTETIFTSAEIPGEVIDVVSIRPDMIETRSRDIANLVQAWDQALDFARTNPDIAHEIMAKRQGISVAEFREALSGVVLLSSEEMVDVLTGSLARSMAATEAVLVDAGLLTPRRSSRVHHDPRALELALRSTD